MEVWRMNGQGVGRCVRAVERTGGAGCGFLGLIQGVVARANCCFLQQTLREAMNLGRRLASEVVSFLFSPPPPTCCPPPPPFLQPRQQSPPPPPRDLHVSTALLPLAS